jgi:ADP-heptose:LPS heptosyltransferase
MLLFLRIWGIFLDMFHNILVVRTDRLGDVILTLPLLPLIRQCYPGARVSMLLSRYTGEIVEGHPYADSLLWYDDVSRRPVPFWKIVGEIRKERFDAVIVVHPTLRLAWMMKLAGIPIRVGSGYRYYSVLFNRCVYEHRKDARRHELEYNLQLLSRIGCPAPEKLERPDYGIKIPPEAFRKVLELKQSAGIGLERNLVVFHPGSGGSAREWPLENFARLAENLQAKKNVDIIITGGQEEEAKARELLRRVGGRTVSFAGMLGLKELAALIQTASLFVSNSTGPLHLAVALDTPVLGFYPQITAMSPQRWGPYGGWSKVLVPDKPVDCAECADSGGRSCACMASISVEMAYESACVLLDQAGRSKRNME